MLTAAAVKINTRDQSCEKESRVERAVKMESAPKVPSSVKTAATLAGNLLSSPPRMPSSQGKERRMPSITPRKFQRFFTPRSIATSQPSASSRALRDITGPALNRCQTPSSPLKPVSEDNPSDDLARIAATRAMKRRKIQHTPASSPPQATSSGSSSPVFLDIPALQNSRRPALLSPIRSLSASQSSQDVTDSEDIGSDDELPTEEGHLRRLQPLPDRGLAAQLVQRMTGGMPRGGHQLMRCPVADWQTETADFYSRPEDVHMCTSHERPGRCMPFCVASCNSMHPLPPSVESGPPYTDIQL